MRSIKRYGWKPDLPDGRDRIYNLERPVLQSHQLPVTFSLRPTMPPVYDQGELGSCTGNGVAAILEHQQMAQSEGAHTPSRLFIYYEERVLEGAVNEDSGAEIRDGLKVIANRGAPSETLWPYDIVKFAAKPPPSVYSAALKHEAIEYLRVLPGTAGSPIRTPISLGFPVVFGFTVYEQFESGWNPATAYLPLPKHSEGVLGGHCCVVIGWDFSLTRFPVNVFEVRNSWGKAWGDHGHFWMDARWLYEPHRRLSSDFWAVEKVT